MAQYFSSFAYDSNYTASVVMNVILGVFDLVVIGLSWVPITRYYNKKVAEKEAPAVTYDEYGCDENGLDVDQKPCRVVAPSTSRYGCEDEDGNPCA